MPTATAATRAPVANEQLPPNKPGRSMWKGAITFGMLAVPVKLYTAQSDQDVKFSLMHRASCQGRVKMPRMCSVCDVPLTSDEIQQVYEVTHDQFLEVTSEDLEALPLPTLHQVELGQFCKLSELDPIYIEKTYHVRPEDVGRHQYDLLRRAMLDKHVVGIGRVTIRKRESLCAVRVGQTGDLELMLLHDADEVRQLTPMPIQPLPAEEVAMAHMILDAATKPFEPAGYPDVYREALVEMLRQKQAGSPATTAAASTPQKQPTDVMMMLRATLAGLKTQQEPAPVTPISKARPRRRAS